MAWLLSWLWQGAALTLLVGLALRTARRLNAATREVVWWVTLAAVLALPALSASGSGPAQPAVPLAAAGGPSSATAVLSPIVIPVVPDWLLAIAIGAWLGIALRGLLRLARSFAHLNDLKRSGEPLEPAREARLTGWLAARAGGRPATLAVADGVDLPSALGFGRAVILVPRRLAVELADADLDRIVLHEYAHLERRDDWARLVQQCVLCFAGVHPAVWWIGRALDLEREAACDDLVIGRTGEPKRYAACLAQVAEMAARSAGWTTAGYSLAPGAARVGRELARRVCRLLDPGQGRRPWPIAAALGAGALATLVAAAMVTTLGTMVVMVDAAPAAWAGVVTLRSRQVAAGLEWLAPRMEATLVPRRAPGPASEARPGSGNPPAVEPVALVANFPLPGASVVVLPADAPSPGAADLGATPIAQRVGDTRSMWPAPAPDTRGAPNATARGPWQKVADAGAAVGIGVKNAGVATAGFFARAGTSIARGF